MSGLSTRCWAIFASLVCLAGFVQAADPPNVVLVITDDQGYGDVGAHGNTMIKTPNLNALHRESVRLTNFHVDPTCAPTRSALMSGRYSTRTGVWHTIMGRSLMSENEITVAETFRANGYRTAMFGKWHLGDNYPCRPHDQGFDETLYNGGGGVYQTPDYYGNDYFDDTYFRNGVPEKTTGYCTDVWFDNALAFIEKNAKAKKPFFTYLSTNAPHGPFWVADKYKDPYTQKGVQGSMAPFYGMITNIDENMGRLVAKLDELKIADNTILIFMTDNGTAAGVARGRIAPGKWTGFNDGMRGTKGSEYEGGHRVPFFVRWPGGGIGGGKDVKMLTAHIDVLPTLIAMCGIKRDEGPALDGISLATEIRGDTFGVLAPRTLFVHSQRLEDPVKGRKIAVMTQQWRLVNGSELYDMQADPSQKTNIAAANPKVVKQLSGAYDTWWSSLEDGFDKYVRIHFGNPAENPSKLTCHDWHTGNGPVPWNQGMIDKGPMNNGYWAVDVEKTGNYEITLRRWPEQLNKSIEAETARIKLGDVDESQKVASDATSATFKVKLKKGPAKFQTWLSKGKQVRGAYFVDVKFVD